MKISRQVGTASEILNLFVSDASVTTGAGLANVIGSSVAYAWWHNDQAAASTGTASTAGAMGIYSTSAWVQISSTAARGWYQFGTPNGVFASGRSAALYFNGAVNMAPLPVEVELTKINNQQYDSSTVFLAHTSTSPANLLQVYGSAIVTSASGQLLVSTQAIDKGGYGVTTVAANITTNANVIQAYGSAVVTSASGQFRVSTQTLTVPDNTGIANISSQIINPMTESYRDIGSTGTMAQLMYEVVAHMGEAAIVVTTKTISRVTQTTDAMTFQLDSSTAPTTITRLT